MDGGRESKRERAKERERKRELVEADVFASHALAVLEAIHHLGSFFANAVLGERAAFAEKLCEACSAGSK